MNPRLRFTCPHRSLFVCLGACILGCPSMTDIVASKLCKSLFQPCISVSTVMVLHGAATDRRFNCALVSGSMMFKLNVIGV